MFGEIKEMVFKIVRVACFLATFISLALFAGSIQLPVSWFQRGIYLGIALVCFVTWSVVFRFYSKQNIPETETGTLVRLLKYSLVALGSIMLLMPLASAAYSLFATLNTGISFSLYDFVVDILTIYGANLATALALFVPAIMIKINKPKTSPKMTKVSERREPTISKDIGEFDV